MKILWNNLWNNLIQFEQLYNILKNIFIIIITVIILTIFKYILNNIFKKILNNTLQIFLRSFIHFIYIIFIIITILIPIIKIPQTIITGLIVILPVTIGFAMRDYLKTVINSIIIIVSKPFLIGDIIITNNIQGQIIEINMFYIKIKTVENKLIIIDNETIFQNTVTKINKNQNIRQDIILQINIKHNVYNIKKIIIDIINNCPYILKNSVSNVVLNNCLHKYNEFKIQIWTNIREKLITKSYINEHIQKYIQN